MLLLSPGCGGDINLQQGGQAQTIATPNYPRQYQENLKCNWKITVSSTTKLISNTRTSGQLCLYYTCVKTANRTYQHVPLQQNFKRNLKKNFDTYPLKKLLCWL